MKKFLLVTAMAVTSLSFVGCAAPAETAAVTTETTYKDGTYRGAYLDGSVEVEFKLKDNTVESVKYRKLKYRDTDFLAEGGTQTTVALKDQYQALIDHLVGKNISAIDDLYFPGEIAQDVDGLSSASIKEGEVIDVVSGATLRSGKIISALNDGLNRGAYKLAE